MKLKILKLDWYCDFSQWAKGNGIEANDLYQYELQALEDEGNSYDGPLRYIESCIAQPFPEREGIKYCIKLTRVERSTLSNPEKTDNEWYWCYCYQLGKWWKYKGAQYLFYDLFVPTFSMRTFFNLKKGGAYQYLSEINKKSYLYWDARIQIDNVYNDTNLHVFKSLKNLDK